LIIPLVIVVIDQLVKRWAAENLAAAGTAEFIPGLVGFRYAENTGAAFSIMKNMRFILVALPAVFSAAAAVLILIRKFGSRLELITLACVLGGAVGNLIDRAAHGYVIDMFEFLFFKFPIFNVADIFVTVGGALFCAAYITAEAKREKQKKEPAKDAGGTV
jgi:signal peptidase II